MKYRALKKVNKNYDTKYTKETLTRELHLTFGTCKMYIIEQQYGHIHTPQILIETTKCSYSISLNDLIHMIDKDANTTDMSLL